MHEPVMKIWWDGHQNFTPTIAPVPKIQTESGLQLLLRLHVESGLPLFLYPKTESDIPLLLNLYTSSTIELA